MTGLPMHPDEGSMSESGPNLHTVNAIIAAVNASQIASGIATDVNVNPRSELDSHANMVVIGKHAFVFESTGRTCNVKPFCDELGMAEDIPIVDAAIAYDCPYKNVTYILLIRNALYIHSMIHNLIPPFIMRAGNIIVNDTPKIHCKSPTANDHSIRFPSCDLRIPLQLIGTFSYFHSRKPEPNEIVECDKLFITPDSTEWNPHCESFERNERSMLNYEGELNDEDRWTSHRMEVDNEAEDVFLNCSISIDIWDQTVDEHTAGAFIAPPSRPDNTCHVVGLAEAINLRGEISKTSASIGSCSVGTKSQCPIFMEPFTTDVSTLEASLSEILSPQEINATINAIVASTAGKPKGIDKEILCKLWCISEPLAQNAIESNTQLCRQSADNTLSRNFSTNDRMLRYRRIQSTFYTDTMFATPKAKSTRQNTCCQVFVSDKGFVAVYPMKSQAEFPEALHWFCKQVGVPVHLIVDGHKAQTSGNVKRFCDQVGTTLRILEVGTPWANRAELYIGLLKEAVRKDMRRSDSPMVLWDYCIQRRARIQNVVPRPLFQNDGLTPHAATFGVPADISNLCSFGWYEWVYFRDEGPFPKNRESLGRVMGPILNEGNEMAQGVMNSKGVVMPRRSIRRLTRDEIHSDVEKRKRQTFDELIRKNFGDSAFFPPEPLPDDFVGYADHEEDESQIPADTDPISGRNNAVFEKPLTDRWIHAEVRLPQNDELQHAKVIGRSKDGDGNITGTYSDDPRANTLTYDVQFPDGEVKEYGANVIAENMFRQVDAHGFVHTMLDSIIDHVKRSDAVDKKDMYVTTKTGRRRLRQTTSGWDFCVLWKDGSEQWIPLRQLKESHPIEVAEYVKMIGIDDEPAFKWWVPFTLRKKDMIISSINSRTRRVTHKYGIELPSTVEEAFMIDKKNGNSLWRDAINKEMENLKVAFDILEDDQSPPPGFKKTSGHIVFDVRMTLERKARWVKHGHKTPEPEQCTFAGVVSRESVRIALTYTALNGLSVCAADIQMAYLQAPSSERHFIICGPEFGLENIGKRAVIVRALYGGKAAGADY